MKKTCTFIIAGLLMLSAAFAQQPSSHDLRAEWRKNTFEVPAIKGRIGIVDFAYTFLGFYAENPVCRTAIALLNAPNGNPADYGVRDFVLDRVNGYLSLVYEGENHRKVEMRQWDLAENHKLVAVNMVDCDGDGLPLLMFYDFDPVTSLLSPLQRSPFDKPINFRRCEPGLQRSDENIKVVENGSGNTALLRWNGKDGFVFEGPAGWVAKTVVLTAHHVNKAPNDAARLQTGDLIFVGHAKGFGVQDGNEMSSAIVAATGDSAVSYFHVAIAEVVDEKVWVIDATPKLGVARYRLDTFLKDCVLPDGAYPRFQVMRLADDGQAAEHVERAKGFVGQPYDSCFLPDNEAQYCSELVCHAYVDDSGEPLFHDAPMNFKSSDGTFSEYWIAWFEKIGRPIPQGVRGSNPNDLSKEKCLIAVDVDVLRYSQRKRE